MVDHNSVLIDGYIQYLILKENSVNVAEIQISDRKTQKYVRKDKSKRINYRESETTYVYGIHSNSKSTKERVWRVPNNWWDGWVDKLKIGDILLVKTKYGLAPIEITRIERLNECPVDIPVKTVVRKL